jgi:hypothetical protein
VLGAVTWHSDLLFCKVTLRWFKENLLMLLRLCISRELSGLCCGVFGIGVTRDGELRDYFPTGQGVLSCVVLPEAVERWRWRLSCGTKPCGRWSQYPLLSRYDDALIGAWVQGRI